MRATLPLLFLAASPALALDPVDVIVVANKSMPESRAVAGHYLAKRKVPAENLVLLDLPTGEDISRADYDAKLAAPLRAALKDRKDAVKVVLTVYGVPLRVGRQEMSADEKKSLAKLTPELEAARKAAADLEKDKSADPKDVAAARAKRDALDRRRRTLSHDESHAAVDSELMLLWWEKYPLDRWVPNPLYFQATERYRKDSPPVLGTCRLDGPTPDIAKRLVDDAIAVETTGLRGQVVIDARGIRFNPKGKDTGHGYAGYDESMRETARLFEKTPLPVTLDDKEPVLPAGAAKGVALYCGWYSHANFVDCCAYERGAVAWHLASSEATTLRRPDSKVWCPNLLKKGVAATLGPVAEPYTVGFPKPAEFFGFLAAGEPLVEAHAKSVLFCSWMTVLIGDPLYAPFRRAPLLTPADVRPSPAAGRSLSP
ncbi:TIGR03790 family protein [bacterium]|nr:TIGR03790 family protein [bacterium]